MIKARLILTKYVHSRKMSGRKIVAMDLKQFLLRQRVLKQYRDILRTIRHVPDEASRNHLIEWARTEFKSNSHHNDEYTIKMLMFNAERIHKELRQSLELSCSINNKK